MTDFIKADDLAAELHVDLTVLFERVIAGEIPAPYWRHEELVAWVAAYRGPARGGTDDE